MSRKITITLRKSGEDLDPFGVDAPPVPSQVDDAPATKKKRKPHPKQVSKRVRNMTDSEFKEFEREEGLSGPEQAAPKPEPVKAKADDDSTGEAFVRMLNRNSVVVAVRANDVPDRVLTGYQFIYGEPTVPRSHGNPDRCDKTGPGWVPFPRPGGSGLQKITEAVSYWIKCMQNDRAEKDTISPDVDWSWLDTRADVMLRRYSELLGH